MKVTTTLVAPGERTVKADGEYVGTITREKEGWRGMNQGSPASRTFTLAAQYVAERRIKRDAIEARKAALRKEREELAAKAKTFTTSFLEALRNSAHLDRANLIENVVQVSHKERAEKVEIVDMIIGVVEEELSLRSGLASSEEILAAFGAN